MCGSQVKGDLRPRCAASAGGTRSVASVVVCGHDSAWPSTRTLHGRRRRPVCRAGHGTGRRPSEVTNPLHPPLLRGICGRAARLLLEGRAPSRPSPSAATTVRGPPREHCTVVGPACLPCTCLRADTHRQAAQAGDHPELTTPFRPPLLRGKCGGSGCNRNAMQWRCYRYRLLRGNCSGGESAGPEGPATEANRKTSCPSCSSW
jgi:hypothetical protein